MMSVDVQKNACKAGLVMPAAKISPRVDVIYMPNYYSSSSSSNSQNLISWQRSLLVISD
jgi:hypothetical protein